MAQNEYRRLILSQWKNWSANPKEPDDAKMRKFYQWLEGHHPYLLEFKVAAGVDRWQYVQRWLRHYTKYGHH